MYSAFNQEHSHNKNNLIKNKIQAYDGRTKYTCKICGEQVVTKPLWSLNSQTSNENKYEQFHNHNDPIFGQLHDHNNKSNLIYNKNQIRDGRGRYTCKICDKQVVIDIDFGKPMKYDELHDHNDKSNLIANNKQIKDGCTRYTCKLCGAEVKIPQNLLDSRLPRQPNKQTSSLFDLNQIIF